MIIIMWFWTRRGLQFEFGLFGWSENSSFFSTLRAWFAFAHSSPYRKSNRSDALLSFLSFRAATRNRIVRRIIKGRIILKSSGLVGDSGSEAGVTIMQVSQGILNHAPLCSAVQNDDSFLSLELYKANRRSEVRMSEPVCRTVSGSHSLTICERYVLSPDGERVRVRGRCLVTLNFTKRTAAAKRGRVSLYTELFQGRIV